MAERMAMATASEREAKALRAQLAAASAAASAHTTPAGKGGAGAAGNAAGGADWGLMRGPTGDALARALQRGYLEADPAHNRPVRSSRALPLRSALWASSTSPAGLPAVCVVLSCW